MTDEQLQIIINDRIKAAPSYGGLLKAAKSHLKTLYPHGGDYLEARLAGYEREPETLLSAHAGVWGTKSARHKTLRRLSQAVFTESGLPNTPAGMFRGEDSRVDRDKLIVMLGN